MQDSVDVATIIVHLHNHKVRLETGLQEIQGETTLLLGHTHDTEQIHSCSQVTPGVEAETGQDDLYT